MRTGKLKECDHVPMSESMTRAFRSTSLGAWNRLESASGMRTYSALQAHDSAKNYFLEMG